jgi:hypothetical protein
MSSKRAKKKPRPTVIVRQPLLQFDFEEHWEEIKPHLNSKSVSFALELGLKLLNPERQVGDPPWLEGRWEIDGQEPEPGELSYYQPWGRCHWMAPFAWAIGRKLYPDLQWGFLTSQSHTVAVGLVDGEIKIVMDILNFDRMTAEESIECVMLKGGEELVFNIGDVFVKGGISEEAQALLSGFCDG